MQIGNSNPYWKRIKNIFLKADVKPKTKWEKFVKEQVEGSGGGGIIPSGTIDIDSNGTHNVANYEYANVNVQSDEIQFASLNIYNNYDTWINIQSGLYYVNNQKLCNSGYALAINQGVVGETAYSILGAIPTLDTYIYLDKGNNGKTFTDQNFNCTGGNVFIVLNGTNNCLIKVVGNSGVDSVELRIVV